MSDAVGALNHTTIGAKRYTLLYILGSGRCGSTLLDLILNGHSQILGLGEISTLNTLFKPLATPELMAPNFNQPFIQFWEKVKEYYEGISGEPFEKINLSNPRWKTILSWRQDDVEKWARANKVLFSCAQQVSGAGILTDASKRPHRLYLLCRSHKFDIKVIHLIRDGRAVTNSYIRRYEDFYGGLRIWLTTAFLSFYLCKRFHKNHWLRIKYEELATNPENVLKNICSFLSIDFEPKMLAYRGHLFFGIGGNPLVRKREDEVISLDERWKLELSFKHRLIFEVTAGWLNRWYGY